MISASDPVSSLTFCRLPSPMYISTHGFSFDVRSPPYASVRPLTIGSACDRPRFACEPGRPRDYDSHFIEAGTDTPEIAIFRRRFCAY